ncbi:DUF1904 family protein [Neobacillus sp. 114]|uniref:DUF1904 family protein n=1 Tax=Neobacillus sp. 114 TaxID=3048535 RepID=UPI001C228E66|nr:DUF1904 family protein [Neobacillus sp. 114]MBU8919161.1 DUF1904 domain-containing protein [Bacillus sp. FJAT-29953]
MPHLRISGLTVDQMKFVSTPLVKELAQICDCDTNNFLLEVLTSTFVFDRTEVAGFPFVEVKWFERGKEVQDQFAKAVAKYVQSLGIPEVEVAFTVFHPSAYYHNGISFESD